MGIVKFLQRILVMLVVGANAFAQAPKLEAIDQVWSGHSVNFASLTTATKVVVAYYDARRRMTLAARDRRGGDWRYEKLDSVTGWDSHNYIALAEDSSGQIHVTGNMHNDPLVYFRTRVAGDISTLARIAVLVEPGLERRMTYPVFLNTGRLILKYRDGGSGNGNEIYCVYDPGTSSWSHLLATPLVDGEGQRNAYFVGPTVGPLGGYLHLAWVWRDTPDAETNHDLSYARSRDLVRWEKSDGTPLELPITLARSEIVDPVPSGGGMINNNTVVGFDNEWRTLITYHKFDARGNTQVYLARREKSGWKSYQVSRWRDFRWDFSGRGSLHSRLTVGRALPASHEHISVDVVRDGEPIRFLLKSKSLRVVSESPGTTLERELRPYIEVPEGMQLNAIMDQGPDNTAIAWATLPPNRDLPRENIPPPTTLWLVQLEDNDDLE